MPKTDGAPAPLSGPIQTAASSAPGSAWQSPWVRAWVALVVVVLAVNLLMVTLAFVTNPGLVVEDYYERGRAMERDIRSRAAARSGWLLAADIPDDLTAEQPAVVRFFVVDQAGQPVTPEAVTFFAYRPADARRDFSAPMVAEGPGRYRADISFPLPGLWDTLFEVTLGEARDQLHERLYVGSSNQH